MLWETWTSLTCSDKWSTPLNLSALNFFVNNLQRNLICSCLLMLWCRSKFWCCLDAYNDYATILLHFIAIFFFCRHGDRTRAFSAPCWDNDNATWDCLLSSASIPVIKHDIHDITVNRIYRDGTVMILLLWNVYEIYIVLRL